MNNRTAFAAVSTGVLAAALTLAGCVTNVSTPSGAQPVAVAPQPPRVYLYPLRGQTAQQQDRDRYDCFNWAGTQSAFDPSRQPLPRETREVVVPAYPPGSVALAGAATGALVGAAVSDPWHRGEGALIGAVAGTMLGAVAESAQKPPLQQVTSSSQRRYDSAASGYERQAAGFQRAMSACLEGRGYAVK
ncbi:MAG: hypothetical protein RL030_2122 [Pseudomonadota bacterium]